MYFKKTYFYNGVAGKDDREQGQVAFTGFSADLFYWEKARLFWYKVYRTNL